MNGSIVSRKHPSRRARPAGRHAVRSRSAEGGPSQRSVATFPSILSITSEPAVLVDRQWRIRALNEAAGRLFQGDEAHTGITLWTVLPELPGSDAEWVLRKAATRRRPITVDATIRSPGRTVLLRAVPVAGGLVIVFTEQDVRQSEEHLPREQEEQFRATFEQAAVGIGQVSLDGRWLRVNDRLCAIVGYDRDELLARSFLDTIFADDPQAGLVLMRAATAGEHVTSSSEKRYVRPDESPVWIQLTISLMRDATGTPDSFICVMDDINTRKEAEVVLLESQTRLRLAMEADELGTFEIDLRTGGYIGSDWHRAVLGLAPGKPLTFADVLGQMHPDDREAMTSLFDRIATTSGVYRTEYRILRPDGSVRWISSVGRTMTEGEQPVRLVGVSRDVTRRREQQERQRFLIELYGRLDHLTNPHDIEATVVRELRTFFGYSRVQFMVTDASGRIVAFTDDRGEADSAAAPFPGEHLLRGQLALELGAGRSVLIANVRLDSRTAISSGAFERAGVRSFVAVPLRRDGRWAATLFVGDSRPRVWRLEVLAMLRGVAEHLWLALENARLYQETIQALHERDVSLAALKESEDRLLLALDAGRMSTWEWNIRRGGNVMSGAIEHTMGFPVETFYAFLHAIHPEDRERVREAALRAFEHGEDYEPEFRVMLPDGRERWLAVRGQVFTDAAGRPERMAGVALNITERKRAEAALKESETRFRTLAEALPQMIFMKEPDGFCTYVNQRWVDYTGLTFEESLGWGWLKALHSDEMAEVRESWERAIRSGKTWEQEFRVRGADGVARWFLGRLIPIYEGDRLVKWFGTATDIDERKRSADAVAHSERLFRSLAAATAQIIWTTDAQGESTEAVILSGIEANLWMAFTGQTPEEMVGRGWLRAVHPDDRERVSREEQTAIAAGEPFELEYRARRYDGAWRVIVERGVPVRDDRGAIELWIGTGTDVTATRAAEAAVRESEARFRRLFEANVFGVMFWTVPGLITDANDAYIDIIGVTREEIRAGRIDWREITPPEWREVDERAMEEILTTGACAPYETAYLCPDGSEVPVLLSAALLPGSPDQGIAIVIDLTERKEQERFEQEFLAGIAHDLKNPLTAIKGQAQLLRQRLRSDPVTEQMAGDGLVAIDINVARVARRLDELMDVALLRAGHMLELVEEPVDLVALTAARAESYQQTTDRHRIVIEVCEQPLIGSWDAHRLERVVDNLFSNAIKYSAGGEVRAQLSREEDAEGAWAVLRISDQGMGIPAADLPHIFTRFRRGSNVRGQVRGRGIGLAGVQLLVEQHGGTIQAESVEGEGSTLTVRLPLAASH